MKIREKLKDKVNISLSYSDIEGTLQLQENFAKEYTLILTTREQILNDQSPNGDQSTGRGLPHFQVATNRQNGV